MRLQPSVRDAMLAAVPSLRAFAISLSGKVDRADDLVQETFLRAIANINSFQPGTHMSAWLFAILRNLSRSESREALAIPLDHGCRLYQHDGVEDLRPDPIQPNPKQPICGEELRATFALPQQDAHLMPKGDELKFQGGTTSNTEGEQRKDGRKNRDHAHDGMAPIQRSLLFSTNLEF